MGAEQGGGQASGQRRAKGMARVQHMVWAVLTARHSMALQDREGRAGTVTEDGMIWYGSPGAGIGVCVGQEQDRAGCGRAGQCGTMQRAGR